MRFFLACVCRRTIRNHMFSQCCSHALCTGPSLGWPPFRAGCALSLHNCRERLAHSLLGGSRRVLPELESVRTHRLHTAFPAGLYDWTLKQARVSSSLPCARLDQLDEARTTQDLLATQAGSRAATIMSYIPGPRSASYRPAVGLEPRHASARQLCR